MHPYLAQHFEDLLETFLIGSGKDISYYRNTDREEFRLYNDFADFMQSDGVSVYREANWITQHPNYLDGFLTSLTIPSKEEGITSGKDVILTMYSGLSSRDVELLIKTFGSIGPDKKVKISSSIGYYVRFKVTGNKLQGRESLTSDKYYHISRFTKIKNNNIPKENLMSSLKIMEMVNNGDLKLIHNFKSAKIPSENFMVGEHVFNMNTWKKHVIKIKHPDDTLSVSEILINGIESSLLMRLPCSVFSYEMYTKDSDGIALQKNDIVRISTGNVSEILKDMYWEQPSVTDPLNRNFLLYKTLLAQMNFCIVYIKYGYAYLNPTSFVPQYPRLVSNMGMDGIVIKTYAKFLELSPLSAQYLVRTNNISTDTTQEVIRKAKEEEEMSRKKREREETLKVEKELLNFDVEKGPYVLSHLIDKIVKISAPEKDDQLNGYHGEIGKVLEASDINGRVRLDIGDKILQIRASVGHIQYIEVVSNLVVSTEETPELV